DPDDHEAIAAQLYVEMLESGYTSVGELHYLHHDADGARYADRAEMSRRLVAAAACAGIGLTLMPVLYRHGGFGGAPATSGQRRFLCDRDAYAAIVDAVAGEALCTLGFAPHSLRAVTP